MGSSRPIDDVIADPATPAALRERLAWIHEVRTFASRLGLEVNDQYTRYVEWPGDRVVTTVVATPPGSLEPHEFWFPIVGNVPYKGFFDLSRAEAEAARLRADHYDVCIVPVRAYSTLGWFEDPITGPMLRGGDGTLVETLMHELVHATVYLPSEADFNEGVANFIGEEASVRFFTETRGAEAGQRERQRIQDDRAISNEVLGFRREVEQLYASGAAEGPRSSSRAAAETRARGDIARLRLRSRDPKQVASQVRLSDACLALASTYLADMFAYEKKLDSLGGDLPAFIARLRKAAEAEDPRAALLQP